MAGELQPVRAVVVTVVGGVVGGLVLAAIGGYGAEALLETGAGGLAGLLYAVIGLLVGATLGAAAAVALAFRGAEDRRRGVTVLAVLVGGLLWAVAWWLEPALIWAGVVVLPAAALAGRVIATR
jgi:4-amino-4-deoxy-L-arabinose transferase-like glycosyltransferase